MVEIYQRSAEKMWLYFAYGNGDILTLESIEFSCSVEVLYEGIIFDTP